MDPSLPICDPHHHLWDHPGDRYLLEAFLRDVRSGHHIVSTVFVECETLYRQGDPEEMKLIGETEFIQGTAAECAGGEHGPTRVAAGIVGHADLTLGPAVGRVLEAHLAASPDHFWGIRHWCAWDASPAVKTPTPTPQASPDLMRDTRSRAGLACLHRYGLSFEAWVCHPQLPELAARARAVPEVAKSDASAVYVSA